MEVFREWHSEFERVLGEEDNEKSQKFEGKLKSFKNWPICAKHTIFATELSHKQVAKTLKTKILKNFPSVFRDWKFYPRGSRKVSPKISEYSSRLEPPPANKSPIWAARNIKTQILKNILSIFHDWDIDLSVSREKSLCGLATGACDWTNPRLSRQNRATLFLKILTIFAKTKYFPKTVKTLKNLFVFNQKNWACEKTFNQVQSYEWIWHSLNIDLCEVCGYQKWDSP